VDYYGEEAERLESEAEARNGIFDYDVEVESEFYDQEHRKTGKDESEYRDLSVKIEMVA
jgi:hypothetical protein